MNERIKEIAEQANAWYPEGYPSVEGGDELWKNLVIFKKEDLAKFAELIVRECVSQCDIERQAFAELVEEYNGFSRGVAIGSVGSSDRIAEAIKEHFGVK
jgi:hypothetical protein